MAHTSIKDIALRLNISTSTVSRALRDRYDVNPETKRQVLELARELKYLPSSQALALKQKRSMLWGVVVPEIDNEFFSDAINGIENVAFESDYNVLICQTRDSAAREIRIIENLLSARVDGIIISLSSEVVSVSHLQRVMDYEVPMVMFDRTSDEIDTHRVLNDNYEGAFKAVSYLIEKGRRKIAHLCGSQNLYISRLRKQGYTDALKAGGLKLNEALVVESGFKREESRAKAYDLLLKHKPDALFCASDNIAIGALLAARDLKLNVPEDLAIMGFSNLSISALLEPPLSTVDQPAFEMGQAAAQLLLETITQRPKNLEAQTRTLQTSLVIRNST